MYVEDLGHAICISDLFGGLGYVLERSCEGIPILSTSEKPAI